MTKPNRDEAYRLDVLAAQGRFVGNLAFVNMLPGSWDKKFANDMMKTLDMKKADPVPGPEAKTLSPKQWEHVQRLCWKYRRQLPAGMMRGDPKFYPVPLPDIKDYFGGER